MRVGHKSDKKSATTTPFLEQSEKCGSDTKAIKKVQPRPRFWSKARNAGRGTKAIKKVQSQPRIWGIIKSKTPCGTCAAGRLYINLKVKLFQR